MTTSVKTRRAAVTSLILALVAFLLWYGGENIWRAFELANPLPLLAAFALSGLLYPIAAWRWALITDDLADRHVASKAAYLRVRCLAAIGGFFAPRELTELGGRTVWLNRWRGLRLAQAVQAVVLDRFCDLLVSVLMLVGPISFGLGLLSADAALVLMAALMAAMVIGLPWSTRQLDHRVTARLFPMLARLPLIGRRFVDLPSLASLSPAIWRWALVLSLVKFMLVALRVVLVAIGVGIPLGMTLMAVLAPLGQLAYAVAITPAGLGIYEAGWLGILNAFDIEAGKIAAFVIVLRGCLIISVLLVTPILLTSSPIRSRPTAFESPSPPLLKDANIDSR